MDDKSKLSLDLYDNLIRIDLELKDLLDINTFKLIDYKRDIINFFNNKYNDLDLTNVEDIKNSYFDSLSIYSKNIFDNLKEIKSIDYLTENERDVIFHFNTRIMTIIENNLKENDTLNIGER